jgi:DNA-binding transcriptional LysR family regulator
MQISSRADATGLCQARDGVFPPAREFDSGGAAKSKINDARIDTSRASILRTPDLVRLRYFLAVAKSLNFREASEALNVAQPAISRAVQMLEAELGFRLLNRTTRRVSLTKAGAVLARDAEEAMSLLNRSMRNARQVAAGEAGEIIVAYSAQSTNGPMAVLVVGFRSAFPQSTISLYTMASHEQLSSIENGEIDVGFLLAAACRKPLSHRLVGRERFVLLVSKHHALAQRKTVWLKELADMPFVLGTAKRWETFRTLVNGACLNAGFLPDVAEEADDVPVLLQLVSLRRGVTLYGSAIMPTLPPDIAAIPIADAHATFDVSVAWDDRRKTPLVQAFVKFVEDHSDAERSLNR